MITRQFSFRNHQEDLHLGLLVILLTLFFYFFVISREGFANVFFAITSCNKKKLKIGNNKVIDKTKICRLVSIILDKLFVGMKPPEDIVVKARLKESSSLIPIKLYKKITKIVVEK